MQALSSGTDHLTHVVSEGIEMPNEEAEYS